VRFFLAAATAAALLLTRPLAVVGAADIAGEADLTSALGLETGVWRRGDDGCTKFLGLDFGVKRGDDGWTVFTCQDFAGLAFGLGGATWLPLDGEAEAVLESHVALGEAVVLGEAAFAGDIGFKFAPQDALALDLLSSSFVEIEGVVLRPL